jgi:ABC-2 type transport system permease protein
MVLKRNIGKTVVACAVIFVVSFALARLYPALEEVDAARISSGWPQLVKDFFGDPFYSFSTAGGWLNIQFYHLVYWIIGGVYVSLLSVMLIAGEVERRKIDIVLSCPVDRGELAGSSALGILIVLPFLAVAAIGGSLLGLSLLGAEYYPMDIVLAAVGALPLFMAMMGISIIIASLWFDLLKALVAVWAVLGLMFAAEEMLQSLLPGLGGLTVLSLFHYYDSADILIRHTFSWLDFLILTAAGLALIGIGLGIFRRRDIL